MGAIANYNRPRWQDRWTNLLLIAFWILGNLRAIVWLLESFKYASSFNLLLIGLIITFVLVQVWRDRNDLEISTQPTLKVYPLVLLLGAGFSGIILRWLIDIPQINLLLFLLGSYGLWGLFVKPSKWRKGLICAILVAFVIPFSAQFNSGLGFPVRLLTASVVENILSDWHIQAISSHDIIILENGIARVDLPCSGLRSLWTGTLFFLVVTWLEKRNLGIRWFLVGAANCLFLVLANVTRVLLLVLINEVWQQQQIAEILHVPLGVIGFIVSCTLTWMLLQTVPQWREGEGEQGSRGAEEQRSRGSRGEGETRRSNLSWLLAIVVSLALVAQIKPPSEKPLTITSFELPQQIVTQTIPLSEPEQNFFANSANPVVQKQRFVFADLSGSMLLVASSAWNAHHAPELCFVGNGFRVDDMESKYLSESIKARWLSLQNGKLSATYWFQSSRGTTDNFLSRIWEDIAHRRHTWVLVSVLFDRSEKPNSPQIKAFTNSIYQAIERDIQSGKSQINY